MHPSRKISTAHPLERAPHRNKPALIKLMDEIKTLERCNTEIRLQISKKTGSTKNHQRQIAKNNVKINHLKEQVAEIKAEQKRKKAEYDRLVSQHQMATNFQPTGWGAQIVNVASVAVMPFFNASCAAINMIASRPILTTAAILLSYAVTVYAEHTGTSSPPRKQGPENGDSDSGSGENGDLGNNSTQIPAEEIPAFSANETEPADPIIPVVMNVVEILNAADEVNNTQSRLPVSISFKSEDCANEVLAMVFDEPINSNFTSNSTSSSNNTRRANATLWESSTKGVCIKQLNLTTDEIYVAVGMAADEQNCTLNINIDPSDLPNSQKLFSERVEVEKAFLSVNETELVCTRLPGSEIVGRGAGGNTILEVSAEVCFNKTKGENEGSIRQKRDLQFNSTSTESVNNTAAVSNETLSYNQTELTEKIIGIRERYCSSDVTLVTNRYSGAVGIGAVDTGPVNAIITEIQKLCPNMTLHEVPAGNCQGIMTSFSLVQGLEKVANNITASEVIIIDTNESNTQDRDDYAVTQLIVALRKEGVSVYCTDDSWAGDVVGVMTDVSIAGVLSKSSPEMKTIVETAINAPEPQAQDLAVGSIVAFVGGGLIVLASLTGLCFKQRRSRLNIQERGASAALGQETQIQLTGYTSYNQPSPDPDSSEDETEDAPLLRSSSLNLAPPLARGIPIIAHIPPNEPKTTGRSTLHKRVEPTLEEYKAQRIASEARLENGASAREKTTTPSDLEKTMTRSDLEKRIGPTQIEYKAQQIASKERLDAGAGARPNTTTRSDLEIRTQPTVEEYNAKKASKKKFYMPN